MKMQERDYVSFQRACVMLAEKLTATKEEVALWAWLGKRCGGIDAYSSPKPSTCSKAEGCDDFNLEHCGSFAPSQLYAHIPDDLEEHAPPWGWAVDAYFLRREVESFNPPKVGRYISWGELIARWDAHGLTESDVISKVRGRVHDDELTDMAPLFGETKLGSATGAPVSWAMFPLADIEAIEARDFQGDEKAPPKTCAGTNEKHEWIRKAWSIGESWMLAEQTRTGTRPTVARIAAYVEGELSTQQITGPRGKYLDRETIKREALTGITGRAKGENFKSTMGNPQRKRRSPIVKGP